MIKLDMDLSYTLKTNGNHDVDNLMGITFCCNIMAENLRRRAFKVETYDKKKADIGLLNEGIFGIKYCPWCGAEVVRYYIDCK